MNASDLPAIQNACYASNTMTDVDFGTLTTSTGTTGEPITVWVNSLSNSLQFQNLDIVQTPMPTTSPRRYVQVFICDSNENVPIESCLLYQGKPKLTDLTDQELFFEIDIKSALEKHNENRVGYVDKSVKERTEYLDPARIRDLKMTVVTIASF